MIENDTQSFVTPAAARLAQQRGARATFAPARPGKAQFGTASARAAGKAGPEPLVVRYSWRVALVGIAAFGFAWHILQTWVLAPPEELAKWSSTAGVKGVNFAGSPVDMALPMAAIVILVGLAWLIQGVKRGPALTIDASGIKGFTLLGTPHFAWTDISHVELRWHHAYKRQLIVHANRGSASAGWGIVKPIEIPVMTAKVDTPVAKIIAAIKSYRPDIRVERNENATLVAFATLVTRLMKLEHHAG